SVTGSAAFVGGDSGPTQKTNTTTLSAGGLLTIPVGGTATSAADCLGTGFVVGYVQEPGAADIKIEISNDGGSTWTVYTNTVSADGTLSYLTIKQEAAYA